MAFKAALQILMVVALADLIIGQTISCNGRAYVCTSPNEYKLCLPPMIAKIFENNPTKCPSGSKCNNDDPTPCGGKNSVSRSEDGTVISISTNSSKSSGDGSIVVTAIYPDERPKTSSSPKVINTTLKVVKTTPKSIKTTPKSIKTTPKSIKTTTKKSVPKTTPKSIGRVCPSPVKIADPNNCHVFYVCRGLERLRIICSFNTVFNEITQTCESNINSCGNNQRFVCPRSGRFADPKSCYHYYSCQKIGSVLVASRRQCPYLSSFSVTDQRCVYGGRGCSNKLFPEEIDEDLELDEDSESNDDY